MELKKKPELVSDKTGNLQMLKNETKTDPIVLDHHLTRDEKYRERLSKVYEKAEKEGKRVMAAAEFLGEKP